MSYLRNIFQRPTFHLVQQIRNMVSTVPVIEYPILKEKVQNRQVILIDVREPKELKEDGKIPNSINIPLGNVETDFKMTNSDFQKKFGVEKSENFVMSCKAGRRAATAFEKVKALGIDNVTVYSGSFLDWVKNGGPIEK